MSINWSRPVMNNCVQTGLSGDFYFEDAVYDYCHHNSLVCFCFCFPCILKMEGFMGTFVVVRQRTTPLRLVRVRDYVIFNKRLKAGKNSEPRSRKQNQNKFLELSASHSYITNGPCSASSFFSLNL